MRLVAALLLAGLLSAAGAAPAAAGLDPRDATAGPSDRLGVNVQLVRQEPRPTRLADYARIRDLGLGVVRRDVAWAEVEPDAPDGGRHAYRWAEVDGLVGELADAGLRLQPVLGFTPRWAARSTRQGPPDWAFAHFAAFSAAFAERYGPDGTFWREHPGRVPRPVEALELWNEPDYAVFWGPAPEPRRYAELVAAAHVAVHRAAPGVRVLAGGTQLPFVETLLDALRGRPLDGLAVHPYAGTADGSVVHVRRLRWALDTAGRFGATLDVTEIGWPTRGRFAVPEATRAAFLRTLADTLPASDCGVRTVIAHTWVTPRRNPFEREEWFGLVGPSRVLSPSAEVLGAAARQDALAGPPRSARVVVCGGRALVLRARGATPRRRRSCVRVAATMGGRPAEGVLVRLAAVRPPRALGAARTGRDGRARVCVRRGRAAGRWALARVTATRADAVVTPSAVRRLRLRLPRVS